MSDRKEIIRRYKNTVQPMGVYRITNKSNGKILIGHSKNVDKVINSIMFQLQSKTHPNSVLQKDFDSAGEESFTFDVVDYLEPKDIPEYDYTEDLLELESLWLDKLQPYDNNGYNKIIQPKSQKK